MKIVRSILFAIAVAAGSVTAAFAQATINVSGAQIRIPGGTPLTGQLVFTVTDTSNNPVTYTPSGGSPSTATITVNVLNGAVQNTGGFPPTIPNPATMSPTNTRYRIVEQTTGGGTIYYTLPLTNITTSSFSMDNYTVAPGIEVTGAGLPALKCSPSAEYNNTLSSDAYPWVCSVLQNGGDGTYWTQNPSLNPTCGLMTLAIAVSQTGGQPFCVPTLNAYATPGFVFASPPINSPPGPIVLEPLSALITSLGVVLENPTLTQYVHQPAGTNFSIKGVKPINGLLGPPNVEIIAAGDSRLAETATGAGEGIITQLIAQPQFAGNIMGMHNGAVGGDTCALTASRYMTNVYPFRPAATGADISYLFVDFGANDIFQGVTPAAIEQCAQAYLTRAFSDGITPVVVTEYYSSSNSSVNDRAWQGVQDWLLAYDNSQGFATFDTRNNIPPSTGTPQGYYTISPEVTCINYSISGSVLTAVVSNTFTAGQLVSIVGFGQSGAPINAVRAAVLSTGLSSSQFEVNLPAGFANASGMTAPIVIAPYMGITSYTIASGTPNVATFTGANLFTTGQTVYLGGFTGANAYLNGQMLTVLSTGLSGTQFEANVSFATIGSTAATGYAESYIPDSTHAGPQLSLQIASDINDWWGIAHSGTSVTIRPTQSYFNPLTGVTQIVNDLAVTADGVGAPQNSFTARVGSYGAADSGNFVIGYDGCPIACAWELSEVNGLTTWKFPNTLTFLNPTVQFANSQIYSDVNAGGLQFLDSTGAERGLVGALGNSTLGPSIGPYAMIMETTDSATGGIAIDSYHVGSSLQLMINRGVILDIVGTGIGVFGNFDMETGGHIYTTGQLTAGAIFDGGLISQPCLTTSSVGLIQGVGTCAATNLVGGNTGYIPFQTGVGATGFDGANFFYDATNHRLNVAHLIDSALTTTGAPVCSTTGGQLTSTCTSGTLLRGTTSAMAPAIATCSNGTVVITGLTAAVTANPAITLSVSGNSNIGPGVTATVYLTGTTDTAEVNVCATTAAANSSTYNVTAQ